MAAVELSTSQRRILTALINQYGEKEKPIKRQEIADAIDRNPGTVRNNMQSLKALQLVKGVAGLKGGYKPTAETYETLDIQRLDEPADVPVAVENDSVPGILVETVRLKNIHHPEKCRAEIQVQGSLQDVQQEDRMTVGPTPLHGLVVHGVVDAVDESQNSVLLEIEEMETNSPVSKRL